MTEALVLRALTDPGFAGRLKADPRAVLEGELNLPLPEGLAVHVHENVTGALHVVLPAESRTGPLTEQDLAGVSGGGLGGFGGGLGGFGGGFAGQGFGGTGFGGGG